MDGLTGFVIDLLGLFFDDPKQIAVYAGAITMAYAALKGSIKTLRVLADMTSTRFDNRIVDMLAAFVAFVDDRVPGMGVRGRK